MARLGLTIEVELTVCTAHPHRQFGSRLISCHSLAFVPVLVAPWASGELEQSVGRTKTISLAPTLKGIAKGPRLLSKSGRPNGRLG